MKSSCLKLGKQTIPSGSIGQTQKQMNKAKTSGLIIVFKDLTINTKDGAYQLLNPSRYQLFKTIPFIEFEDLTQETSTEASLSQLPGSNLSKLEFTDISNYDGIKGNLNNDYWNEIFCMDSDISSLYWGTIQAQRWFRLREYQIEGRSIK
ncbi:hypothetical protein O181_064933 [Austropuccinia psidii MF-1]|uniref:Uncharacterized protein n=1 Tax=Austropuccinia psidii MF-1 TaxID=1389203 RepID=A0A9Q3I235_9BASI|nr:hypothetical protein [Austropuccinia psidii MF-1]